MCEHDDGRWEWMPAATPDEHETVRNVRAAIAAGDLGRLEHAMEAFRRYIDDLSLEAAPVTVQQVEDVVARWADEGD